MNNFIIFFTTITGCIMDKAISQSPSATEEAIYHPIILATQNQESRVVISLKPLSNGRQLMELSLRAENGILVPHLLWQSVHSLFKLHSTAAFIKHLLCTEHRGIRYLLHCLRHPKCHT